MTPENFAAWRQAYEEKEARLKAEAAASTSKKVPCTAGGAWRGEVGWMVGWAWRGGGLVEAHVVGSYRKGPLLEALPPACITLSE